MNQLEKDDVNWNFIECGLNADRRGNGRKGSELWGGRLDGGDIRIRKGDMQIR